MITEVNFTESHYREPPYKFEAGTPHIAGALGLGAAIDYLSTLDYKTMALYEQNLLDDATKKLQAIPGLRFIGTARDKVAILNFILVDKTGKRIHGHDISDILNSEVGVAVRAGQHCTMPLMQRFNVDSTVRASLAFYNTQQDIDLLVKGLEITLSLFNSTLSSASKTL